jgi:hypothetical protein
MKMRKSPSKLRGTTPSPLQRPPQASSANNIYRHQLRAAHQGHVHRNWA